jgi:hypothetical protein
MGAAREPPWTGLGSRVAAPGPWQPLIREEAAEAPAERPSWSRSRSPSVGQSAAVAARLGHGFPPAAVDPPPTPAPDETESPAVVVADQGDGCGRSDRPPWARPLGQRLPPTRAAKGRRAGAGAAGRAAGDARPAPGPGA